MNKIDKYIDSVYKGMSDFSKETEDLKQEMRDHLILTTKELKDAGLTEEESIKIAIDRFGEEFQLRNEVNQVLNFQRQLAQKILKASFYLLAIATTLVIMSFFAHNNYLKHYQTMNSQIKTVERFLIKQGLDDVDEYLKVIFNGENNSELTYVAIKELPENPLERSGSFPGKIVYSYPEVIKNEDYNNRIDNVVTANNINYLIEAGVKNPSSTNKSGLFIGLALLLFSICWVLWIIWSIMTVYELGYLNTRRYILLFLTGIIGYLILSFNYNLNFNPNNSRVNTAYNTIFGFVGISAILGISLILFYTIKEPYRVKHFLELIFH